MNDLSSTHPRDVTCEKIELFALTQDVSLIRLRLPAHTAPHHFAGQYAKLRVANRWLAFSIANLPQPDSPELSFHFRHLAHHASAQTSLTWLQQHQLIRVSLPHGNCYLDSIPACPIWFICGSTGFAQAKAMIDFLAAHGHMGNVRLFWGARKRTDFYLSEQLTQWQRHLPGFYHEQVLSDETHPHYTQGDAYQRALEQLDHPLQPRFFISGSPIMVDTTCHALLKAGVSASQIHSDMLPDSLR